MIFIALSAILASLGLLANNVVAVIASMVIAPLMGPIIGTSLGTVLSDRKLFKEGLKAEIFGLLLSIPLKSPKSVFLKYLLRKILCVFRVDH